MPKTCIECPLPTRHHGSEAGWAWQDTGLIPEPWKSQCWRLNRGQTLSSTSSRCDLGQVTSPPRAQFPHLTNDKNRIVRFKWDLWRVMGYSKVLKCHLYLYLKAWKPLRK